MDVYFWLTLNVVIVSLSFVEDVKCMLSPSCFEFKALQDLHQIYATHHSLVRNDELFFSDDRLDLQNRTFVTHGRIEHLRVWNEYLRHRNDLMMDNEEDSLKFFLGHICSIDHLIQLFANKIAFLVQNTRESEFRKHFSRCQRTILSKNSYNVYVLNMVTMHKVQRILLSLKVKEEKNVFLIGEWTFNAEVLRIANRFNLLTTEYIWFFSHNELPVNHFELIPVNSLAIKRVRFSRRELMYEKTICTKAVESGYREDEPEAEMDENYSRLFVASTFNEEKEWKPIASINVNNVTLHSDSLELLSRFRSSQMFLKLKVVTIIDPPFTFIHQGSSIFDRVHNQCDVGKLCWMYDVTKQLQPHCCIGICIDLLNLMERDMGFVSDLYIVEDSTYGAKVNGTWVGMVGDLVNGKADLVAAALTISSTRSQVISFTDAFMVGGAGLMTVMNKSEFSFWNIEFIKPLTNLLWLATAVAMVTASVLLKMAEKFGVHPRDYVLRQTLLYVNGLVFQRNIGGEEPTNVASRFIALTFAFMMLVVMSTYTAVLTANKVTHKTELPLTGFKDPKILHPTTAFKYGTISNSVYTDLFRNSQDPAWNRMYHFMLNYNFRDTSKAIKQLKAGDLNAIIHDYQILLHFMSKEEDCTLQMAGEPIKDAGYGFAVQKDDPKESWLSELIRRYQREGILQQLTTTWINTKCIEGKSSSTVTSLSSSDPSESSSDNHVDGAIDQFSASNFGGLLIILISSSFAAVFILFCEIQYSKRRQKVSQDLTAAIYTLNVKSVDLKEIKILDEDSAILYERKILNDIRLSPLVYSHKVIPSQEEEKYIT